MDEKDYKIIELLLENSRLTTKQLSRELGIPQTTVHNRIKRLRAKGIIKRFTIELDKKKLGRGLVAYIFCTVSYRSAKGKKIDQYEVAQSVKAFPEVDEVSVLTGEVDLLVRVALRDVDALNEFVIFKLRNIDGIERTTTSVVLMEA